MLEASGLVASTIAPLLPVVTAYRQLHMVGTRLSVPPLSGQHGASVKRDTSLPSNLSQRSQSRSLDHVS